jgi:hypothetical protein
MSEQKRVTLPAFSASAKPASISPLQWEVGPVNIGVNEYAIITPDPNGKWFVPGRNCGPFGDGVPAAGTHFFTQNGAQEGCLLVRDGNGAIYPFTDANRSLEIHVAGSRQRRHERRSGRPLQGLLRQLGVDERHRDDHGRLKARSD